MKNNKFEVFNDSSLVNLSNSLLKHFGAPTFHDTIPEIDDVLKGHKKVVLMLFDGMGRNIIRKHLSEDSYIRSHYLTTINSTFPPTTAAATTAVLSGKYPKETGWLAWDLYFKEFDRNLILFTGKDYNSDESVDNINRASIRSSLPYVDILELIRANNPAIETKNISRYPIDKKGPKNLRQSRHKLNRFLKDKNEAFVYYYFDSPDYEMHANGIDHKLIRKIVNNIDKFVSKISKQNPDTLFLTIADHGHVNTDYLNLDDHSDLCELMIRPASMEKRASMFFIKEGKKEEFADLFNKYYSDKFVLLDKNEIISSELFGKGKPQELFDSFMGDFIAISISNYSLIRMSDYAEPQCFPGHHGGGTKEEREIDVSAFNI